MRASLELRTLFVKISENPVCVPAGGAKYSTNPCVRSGRRGEMSFIPVARRVSPPTGKMPVILITRPCINGRMKFCQKTFRLSQFSGLFGYPPNYKFRECITASLPAAGRGFGANTTRFCVSWDALELNEKVTFSIYLHSLQFFGKINYILMDEGNCIIFFEGKTNA